VGSEALTCIASCAPDVPDAFTRKHVDSLLAGHVMMSTACYPAPNAEADEQQQPHYDAPPSSQLHDGPFAHQLNPTTAAYASSPPQNAHRPARGLRQHDSSLQSNGAMASASASASANGNGQPMAVPGGRMNGHGHGNGAHLREMGFAGPRSPPNNKSRPQPPTPPDSLTRQAPPTSPASSTGKARARRARPARSCTRTSPSPSARRASTSPR
jgi:hypothetical protein